MAYQTTNPYTGEVVKTFATATEAEVDAAIAKADSAFRTWRKEPVPERLKILAKAADLLEASSREYAETLTLEMGKLIGEAEAEVALCVDILRYYVRNAAEQLTPRFLSATGYGDTDVQLIAEPQGVLYAVEPWNFPFYQVVRIGAPQLAAGNTLILKHASNVPQSALLMERLFAQASGTEGLIVNVFASYEASERILGDARVRGAAFTGSEGAGAAVATVAAKNLKKSTLELGGADAFIVLEDADVDKAVSWAVFGRHWNCGQVCCSSKRIIVVESVYDAFMEKYRAGVAALKAGDPMDPDTTLAPLSSQAAVDDLKKQIDQAVARGAKLEVIGAEVPSKGSFARPVLLTNVTLENPAFKCEFFGPVSMVFRVRDEAEAIAVANDSPFGLGGSVFTQDIERGRRVAAQISTGMVYINHPTAAKADLPFGGIRRSGFGRELIDLGLKEFVNHKLIGVTDIDGNF